ncbi:transcription termination factor MTEF18, mitochondrial-like isoform X1 [Punica granatum]|nr:transcription termination factor MTEF18, mitochondrial-like isoform X1 [Punica granatum]
MAGTFRLSSHCPTAKPPPSTAKKLRARAVLKWVSSSFIENQYQSLNLPLFRAGFLPSCQNPRFYRTEKTLLDESSGAGKISATVLRKAQSAFSDYLHSTRSLQYAAAESISRNSPRFLSELLEKIELDDDIQRSLARFLRYHPINEFEPFFESIGLKPSEYAPLLPRNLMFLDDCDRLLTNYLVLCNYGIEHCKIGRIYKDAKEIFEYDHGALLSKIRAYENLGISQHVIVKAIVCSPQLLIGDMKTEFVDVLERFRVLGFEQSWVEKLLCEDGVYRWSQILELLCVFTRMGFTNEQLNALVRRNPGILFEDSGAQTFSIIELLIKFGSERDTIQSVFLEFPQISVEKFLSNLRQCFMFLTEIEMETVEIGRIIRTEARLLGSSTLKKANSLLANLNVGKRRLRDIVKQNPKEMGNWVMGMRVRPVAGLKDDEMSLLEKKKFLSGLGFMKESKNMERAIKSFRGKGYELQERFDCIVNAGLSENDVCEMVRVSPQILNQTKDVIEMKIDFLVNEVKYPISSLRRFPSYLSFKTDRIKVRLLMFKWLSDKGLADPLLALSTIIACSDGAFEKYYVKRHPDGLKVWHNLRESFVSESSYAVSQ